MAMADKFDPYREALVMETQTEWPEEFDDLDPREKARLEMLLHDQPDQATELEYIRTHTGFCRRLVVADEDLQRVAG